MELSTEAHLSKIFTLAIMVLFAAPAAYGQMLVDPTKVAPEYREAAEKRRAEQLRQRYADSQQRRARAAVAQEARLEAKAQAKLEDLAAHSRHTDPQILAQKRAVVEAALARARAKRAAATPPGES